MTINNLISIDTVYTRSINIERDFDSEAIVNAYIPTSRALLTLNRIAETLHNNRAHRSWALIGPYGAGKSSFAVFLSHLFGPPQDQTTKSALRVLRRADKSLCSKYSKNTKNTRGYLPVLLTGSPEPFAKRFIECLRDSAIKFWKNKRGPTPIIVKKLGSAASKKQITPHNIICLVEELQTIVTKSCGKGILIVFDEFGKFLEYEARHYGANDIYLLQLLAEHANKSGETNLYVLALMHQGFEQYARGLGENLRNEWGKIQGRYESIPFLETTEQTLRVMAKAFRNKLNKNQNNQIVNNCKKIVKILSKENALPGVINENDATELFAKCYPLHPVSSLILPFLCQKMAQNERTLFSYLGSKELHGFDDSIGKIEAFGNWVAPWEIYEYFILNQPTVLNDPTIHRRWAEVVTALERLGDAPSEQIQLLKTIGLLNIIGAHGGLKASKDIVKLCHPTKQTAVRAVKALQDKSIISYRKYSGEYRVWQGSDFDLDTAVQDELNQIGRFNLAEAINIRESLLPIVARRHTIRTGALRYFQHLFVDVDTFSQEQQCSSKERIIFCLIETPDDIETFENEIKSYFSDLDIIVMAPNGAQLREAVGETLALERVQTNRQELNSDPVAQREFKDRVTAAEQLEGDLLSTLLDSPENCQWYWKATNLNITSKRSLQKQLSEIMDQIYYAAPILKNELINRDKPSAQATAARNKLVSALLNHSDQEDLGIEKYPAEKGIYRALFKATGLHRQVKGNWKVAPPNLEDPKFVGFNLGPVWQRINEFIATTEERPKSFADLSDELHAPPYGLKLGVLPIIYISTYICYKDELAFYENGVYVPYITEYHVERFLKRPDVFAIQRIQIKGIRASLLQEYTKVLYGEKQQKQKLISIARPLAKFMVELEDYTKNTGRISDTAQKFRKAFDLSKSPAELLFVKLPKACGYPSINPDDTDRKKVEGFAKSLVAVIRELRDAYSEMVKDFQRIIAQTLLPDTKKNLDLANLRIKLRAKYEDLSSYTADIKDLRPFIDHLSDDDCDDETWLNRLLLFLSNKPPKKWSDVVRDGAISRLIELSKRLIDLCVLQSYYLKNRERFSEDFDVILLKSMRHGHRDYNEVVTINKSKKEYISGTSMKISNLLDELQDDEARLAVLATLVDELLKRRKENTNADSSGKIRIANG